MAAKSSRWPSANSRKTGKGKNVRARVSALKATRRRASAQTRAKPRKAGTVKRRAKDAGVLGPIARAVGGTAGRVAGLVELGMESLAGKRRSRKG